MGRYLPASRVNVQSLRDGRPVPYGRLFFTFIINFVCVLSASFRGLSRFSPPLFRKVLGVGLHKTVPSVSYQVGAVGFLQSLNDLSLIVRTEILQ